LQVNYHIEFDFNMSQDAGCKVTGRDVKSIPTSADRPASHFFSVKGDMADEESMKSNIAAAQAQFGPINMLIANAGVSDELHAWPIWKIPLDVWEKRYHNNIRGNSPAGG
jgi:NADP-dependent 3-hydroxy acid dehydrogenase YdfG